MRIDIAIVSSTPDPFYLDFWPVTARCWRELGIEPVLLYVPDDGGDVPPSVGSLLRIPGVSGIPDYLQALWARYWFTRHFWRRIVILSDIDMLPLSRRYFVGKLSVFDDADYVHLTASADRLPSCYHVARGDVFSEVLGLEDSFESSLQAVMLRHREAGRVCKPVDFWAADEFSATERIRASGYSRLRLLPRRAFTRIDRAKWRYSDFLLKHEHYIDAHLPRPFAEHKEEILRLIDKAFLGR